MNAIKGPQSTDNTLRPTSRAYIVHDRRTGKVLHIHHSVIFPQTKLQGETPEARARRFAGGNTSPRLAVLEVDSDDVNDGMPIKVDVAHQRVVRLTSGSERTGSGSKKSRASAASPKRPK
jgi:hypothetical protein